MGVHDQVVNSIYCLLELLATRNLPVFVKAFEDMVVLLADLDFLCHASLDGNQVCIECFQVLFADLKSAESDADITQGEFQRL